MADIRIGRWALIAGYCGKLSPDVHEIAQVTNKLVKYVRYGSTMGQSSKSDVLATYATKEAAQYAQQILHGIRGERERRIQAAHTSANDQADKFLADEQEPGL